MHKLTKRQLKTGILAGLCIMLTASMAFPARAEELYPQETEILTWEEETSVIRDAAAQAAAEDEDALLYAGDAETENALADYLNEGIQAALAKAVDEEPRSNGQRLTGLNREAYEKVAAFIKKVAKGEETYTDITITVDVSALEGRTWTAQDLGLETLVTETDEGLSIAPEVHEAMKEQIGYDSTLVILSLLRDYPAEMFWFGLGYYFGVPYDVLEVDGEYRVVPGGEIRVILSVSPDYSAYDDAGERIRYTVDTEKITRVNEALANAADIVAEAAGMDTDRERLSYYYDTICSLSGYDFEAAAGAPYGDPWQIISVFDGDPETMVVCEGYSKALQYLCDNTEFDSDLVRCLCAVGWQTWEGRSDLPPSHMWNVVRLEDGLNYLVDITNGYQAGKEYLFLASCESGNMEKGYSVYLKLPSGKEFRYLYIYDEDTKLVFPEEDLRLAGNETPIEEEPVDISEAEVQLSVTSVTYNGKVRKPKVTVTIPSDDGEITLVQGTDYTVAYEDNQNAGTGKVLVKGLGKYTGTVTKTFKINKVKISTAVLKKSADKTLVYNGKERKPVVAVQAEVNGTVKKLTENTDYTVKYSANKNVGTATAVITGKGNYSGTKKVSFKILPKAVTLKSLTAEKAGFTAKWAKQTSQTTGYQIQYSASKTFSSGNVIKTVSSNQTVSKKITGLKNNKTYYVRIRTFKTVDGKKYCSAWSDALSVKTKE